MKARDENVKDTTRVCAKRNGEKKGRKHRDRGRGWMDKGEERWGAMEVKKQAGAAAPPIIPLHFN